VPVDEPAEESGQLKSQRQTFVDAWTSLLSAARLKLTHTSLDLASLPDATRNKLFEKLRAFDVVVLAGKFTDAQLTQMREAGVHIADARDALNRQLTNSDAAHTNPTAVTAVYTGVVPVVYKAQRALLENLMQSSFWSFVTITPLLMLVTRSIAGGAVVMLPNILPILVVFGGMSWLGIAVDIGSMMSASIALGVAVDDTIHYLTWFRADLARLGDRLAAIRSAYRHCAPPTLQAALISGLGLSVFAFSTFTPTQRLGWLMMTILLAGVVAELVMMPALLAGPLGKVFPVGSKKPTPSDGKGDDDTFGLGDSPPTAEDAADGGPPTRADGRRVFIDNGAPQPAAGRHHPHSSALGDRLANLKRSARDGR
jgi:hypothetical protein